MDQPVTPANQSPLEKDFHHMVELSRTLPPPSLEQRLDQLARLRSLIADNESRFAEAISADFGHRATAETVFAEVLFLQGEIRHTRQHLKRWMAPQRIPTQRQFFPATNRLLPQPLGVVGIIAPWNYPLQLTLAPAIGALAAGNRVMIKPSELAPRFAALLQQTIADAFDPTDMTVTGIDGDIAERFSTLPFDHLIFTGSTRVGRLVAEAAGRNLTPVTLELGGKSPAIIDRSADLDEAAARIAYGKLLNAGQTCIAPDYALVAHAAADSLATKLLERMKRMYGTAPDNPTSTIDLIDHADPEVIDGDAANTLKAAYGLYNTVLQIQRVCLDGAFDPDEEGLSGFVSLLCEQTGHPALAALEQELEAVQQSVRAIFKNCIG